MNLKEGQKTILVASQYDADGKTFIAQHLTDSLTAIGKKALLINADLRETSNLRSSSARLLPEGRKKPAADILGGEEFAKQVAQAKAANDFVVFDSPALGQYADAYQLATFADVTLFVVKAGHTKKSDIEALNADTKLPNVMFTLNK